MTLPDDILASMKRLEALGETSVHPSRVADLISPRPSLGAMSRAMEQLWEDGLLDHGRTGLGRYCLSPVPYAEPDEQLSMTNQGG